MSEISVVARSANNSSAFKLQASTDGGATFSDVETFSVNSTAASNRHAWAAGQAEGTVFRLLRSGSRAVNVHDIHITVTAAAEVPLAGMPANVVETVYMLENLAPSTTYYVTVKAQGRGWETEWSEPLEVATADGAGTLPVVTLPEEIPGFTVGVEGTLDFAVSGHPQPVVTVKASSVAGEFSFATNSWDDGAMSGSYTFAYRPAAADRTYGTQTFTVAASNSFGVHSAVLSIRVLDAEDAFAQWLSDRFGATTNSAGFAARDDADGDGMSTWQEFFADTCPTDKASQLRFELQSPASATQAVFRFDASTSRWYQLVYWTNLLEAPRTNDLGWGPASGTMEFGTNIDLNWFGRLRALLAPPPESNDAGNE